MTTPIGLMAILAGCGSGSNEPVVPEQTEDLQEDRSTPSKEQIDAILREDLNHDHKLIKIFSSVAEAIEVHTRTLVYQITQDPQNPNSYTTRAGGLQADFHIVELELTYFPPREDEKGMVRVVAGLTPREEDKLPITYGVTAGIDFVRGDHSVRLEAEFRDGTAQREFLREGLGTKKTQEVYTYTLKEDAPCETFGYGRTEFRPFNGESKSCVGVADLTEQGRLGVEIFHIGLRNAETSLNKAYAELPKVDSSNPLEQ